MSRAFVKEDDAAGDGLTELPVSSHPNPVTRRGLALLRDRQAGVERRLAQLTATTLDAELERSRLQRDLRWLNARIASAIVIAPERPPADRVAFGACVDVVDNDSGERRRYRIVGEDEAAPEHGDVSWRSPLARALDGARVGDQVTWPRPAGPVDLEIRAIRYEDG